MSAEQALPALDALNRWMAFEDEVASFSWGDHTLRQQAVEATDEVGWLGRNPPADCYASLWLGWGQLMQVVILTNGLDTKHDNVGVHYLLGAVDEFTSVLSARLDTAKAACVP